MYLPLKIFSTILKIISFKLCMHVHARTPTLTHTHSNRVSHIIAFLRMRWTCCSAATKPSNFGRTVKIVACCSGTVVPCYDGDFMRAFYIFNREFMPEWWMVEVLRDTPPPLSVSNKQQSWHTALVSYCFPLDRVLNQRLHNTVSFQATRSLLFWMEPYRAIQDCCHFSVVLAIIKLRKLPTLFNTHTCMLWNCLHDTEVLLSFVVSVCQCFAVLEDGALAHNLQEQESKCNVKLPYDSSTARHYKHV